MTKITIDIGELIRTTRSAAVAGPGQVGVVSTITMKGTNLEAVFTNGLAAVDSTVQIRAIKDKNDYKHGNTNAIQNWIKSLSLTCDLIVTVGGAVAYEAAVMVASSKPFISVLGAIPKSYPTEFRGGVSLSSLDMYSGAVQALMSAPFNLLNPQICFLYNPNNDFSDDPNSLFADNELNYWTITVNANVTPAGTNNQGNNDLATFVQAIQALAATQLKGIVVSADPFFQDTKQSLITAVNTYWLNDNTRFVCYPSFAYKNVGGTLPTAARSIIYGPNLEETYFLAGQLAGTYVHSLKGGTDLPPVFVRVSGTKLIL
jgi:hypothetical protein